MLLNSVIIILREVLEASLLISVLLVFSKQLNLSYRWIVWALVIGFSGAFFYAANISSVSGWFDGVGQELTNALLQQGIFILLLFIIILVVLQFRRKNANTHILTIMMGLIVSLAIIREGSEIFIYLTNFTQAKDLFLIVISGAVIGAGIGCSIGIIVYYLLCNIASRWSLNVGSVLLILIAAGMVSQASLLLIQADWLPSQLPLWDSSDFISEQSVIGQLLYAVIGYEATPTPIQAGLYCGALTLLISLFLLTGKITPKEDNPS